MEEYFEKLELNQIDVLGLYNDEINTENAIKLAKLLRSTNQFNELRSSYKPLRSFFDY